MNEVYNAIMGAMVGDAIGTPAKSLKRGSYAIREMISDGRFQRPAGTYSSNGASILATIDSINEMQNVNTKDLFNKLKSELQQGKYHAQGEMFDIDSEYNAPNINALGRIIPFAFLPLDPEQIATVTSVTDANKNAHEACLMYICACKQILWGNTIEDIIKTFSYNIWSSDFKELGEIATLSPQDIKSTSDITDILAATFWCVYGTSSYEKAVLLAANLGGNTNTLCTAVGGLAGLIYGTETKGGIPASWMQKLQNKEYIEKITQTYITTVHHLSQK